jgi:hypothetical protein
MKMDKENLYYICPDGTNEPFIGTKNTAEKYRDKWCESQAVISIKEYEDTFMD